MGNAKHWLLVNTTGKVYEDSAKLWPGGVYADAMLNPIRLGILLRLVRRTADYGISYRPGPSIDDAFRPSFSAAKGWPRNERTAAACLPRLH